MSDCLAIGTYGIHSDSYLEYEDGQCAWCGEKRQMEVNWNDKLAYEEWQDAMSEQAEIAYDTMMKNKAAERPYTVLWEHPKGLCGWTLCGVCGDPRDTSIGKE